MYETLTVLIVSITTSAVILLVHSMLLRGRDEGIGSNNERARELERRTKGHLDSARGNVGEAINNVERAIGDNESAILDNRTAAEGCNDAESLIRRGKEILEEARLRSKRD